MRTGLKNKRMSKIQKPPGRYDTGIPRLPTGNGSASTYRDTPRPAPAGLARDSVVSLGHYFSARF